MEKVIGFHKYDDPDVRRAAQRVMDAAENLWTEPLGVQAKKVTPEIPIKTGQAFSSASAMLRTAVRKFHRVERRYGIFAKPLEQVPAHLKRTLELREQKKTKKAEGPLPPWLKRKKRGWI